MRKFTRNVKLAEHTNVSPWLDKNTDRDYQLDYQKVLPTDLHPLHIHKKLDKMEQLHGNLSKGNNAINAIISHMR